MAFENVWEEHGVYVRVFGAATAQDILESNELLYRDPRFSTIMTYQICDFLGCTTLKAEAKVVKDIARRDAEMSKRKPGVHVAIVTDLKVVYGFSRMYQMCTDQSTWETEIFDHLEAARAWIASKK
ncbi:MAG: hypothetical protein KIS92_19230 [Planctomycetota bacterium]|nr:hypothetical protein [Planctomycetota bacterium]